MRLNSKGQVTIPAKIREKYGLRPGGEIDVVEVGDTLRIVRRESSGLRGQRAAQRLRGSATTSMTTDEIMTLLRDERHPCV